MLKRLCYIESVTVLLCLSFISYTLSLSSTTNASSNSSSSCHHCKKSMLTVIKETTWRMAAAQHSQRIRELLQPALTSKNHPLNSGLLSKGITKNNHHNDWTALDPVHPVYNFLIEYYGLKGVKGPKRLARWSPDPSLLLFKENSNNNNNICQKEQNQIYDKVMEVTNGEGGIFLENANENDYASGILHLRGAIPIVPDDNDDASIQGIVYNPAVFYNRQGYYNLLKQNQNNHNNNNNDDDDDKEEVKLMRQKIQKQMAPFQWYESILRTTLDSEPIFHCYGLHEWAMQYHPEGSDPPPSAKYQSLLPLRVSRQVINETVERKGISCTHVDALRFFAPAAGPLNHHGAVLERTDQIQLEQKACVHAHMDLLKIVLKLGPFVDSTLVADVLELSLQARTLDVGASPYDATSYHVDIIPVETTQGRRRYRDEQRQLMMKAEPIRQRVYQSYHAFLQLAFPTEFQINRNNNNNDNAQSYSYAAPERFAKAEPGGKPWRQNLIPSSQP